MNQLASTKLLNNGSKLEQDPGTIDLASHLNLLIEKRVLITIVALFVTMLGAAYSFIATPIYQSNILLQVENGVGSSGMMLGDLTSAFEMKSAATAEIEILRSRYVVSRGVTNAQLDIQVEPKRFPIVGEWIARGKNVLSNPGLFGLGGYVWGAEKIQVSSFEVPRPFEGEEFIITATAGQTYAIFHDESGISRTGRVGETLVIKTDSGEIKVNVSQLEAKEGAQFILTRAPLLEIVQKLQKTLVIAEKGKQSGIIGVSLEGTDRIQTATALNEIGREYLRQNVERKSVEAEKSLAFLEKQLPELKRNLEQAEATYNEMRNKRGTVDLGEEAKSILQQSVLTQTRLTELKQRRDELLTRYQESNPLVAAVNEQIRTLNSAITEVNGRIKNMPSIEQDVLRLTRDIKVNTELYTSLLNSAQQLKLVKASKVGNARLLDEAVIPLLPVRPQRGIVILVALGVGLFLGIGVAFSYNSFFGGIEDPSEIERMFGINISAAVPYSPKQETLFNQIQLGQKKVTILAKEEPSELAVESLRSLRTTLQFSMLSAKNKVIMITGPTPGVGKSFISVNFAVVLAAAGKKILLIDGDLRKGYLQRYFGLERNNGLSEVVSGSRTFADVVHRSVVENVDFLATGMIPPQPSELLEHQNFSSLLKELEQQYDLIVIDTAPVLAVADALVVAPHVGVTFNVVRAKVTSAGEIEESMKRLTDPGHHVAGIVFNGLRPRIGRYGLGSKYARYRYTQYKY